MVPSAGGPPGSPEEDGDRYIEIWNLVFMQFDRQPDGELTPLPKPWVDTGMGLERIAAVMQGVHSNYEIDLFQRLIGAVGAPAGINDPDEQLASPSLRVIADHIRSCAFLIVDGVLPGNEGRGYVLRRIIRRAMRHGHKLGIREPFFHKLVAPLVERDGRRLSRASRERAGEVEERCCEEERAFRRDPGARAWSCSRRHVGRARRRRIPGEVVFQLYDTYGFPADLTADIARERGLTLDMDGFERAHGGAARARPGGQPVLAPSLGSGCTRQGETAFLGYERLEDERQGARRCSTRTASRCSISTGGDAAWWCWTARRSTPSPAARSATPASRGDGVRFEVGDTQKSSGDQHLHIGVLEIGHPEVGQQVHAARRRRARAAHHAATTRPPTSARGAAPGARRARAAEGLAGGTASGCASTSPTPSR